MSEFLWRFPNNNYTEGRGLDTPDMETFRKDPVASLAREICQNSLDATNGNYPVRVEFQLFSINRDQVPGINELTEQIKKCYEYKKDSPKEGKALAFLKESIEKPEITCLRISDFNTKGVEGASTKSKDTPFYKLTKGTGESDKSGPSGGSKGIGKFASFVASSTNTVFYSTKAIDGTNAFIGISKLRSVPIDGDDELMTLGVGYYGANEKNHPILQELHIDSAFTRHENDYGTDVYLIGFNSYTNWKIDIIAKVLDSFMVALKENKLEVIVDDTLISSTTIQTILDSQEFKDARPASEQREIAAQYELLDPSSPDIEVRELDVEGNPIKMIIKQYKAADEAKATKQCAMIRYPYMKITSRKTTVFVPFSAMCIIEDSDLLQKLRLIENPQHTDWEINRLNDFPKDRKETNHLRLALFHAVDKCISDVLHESSSDQTDVEGAGQFLPSQSEAGESSGGELKSEQILINPVSHNKLQNPKTNKAGEDGEEYDFDTGAEGSEGSEGRKIKKRTKNPHPNPEPKPAPNPDDPHFGPGDKPFLKKIPMNGIRYRNIVTDKWDGHYDCIFTATSNENNCDFEIKLCGEGADRYPVKILKASINGQECTIKDGKIVDMKIEKDQKYKITYVVDSREMFASEVIMNAYR